MAFKSREGSRMSNESTEELIAENEALREAIREYHLAAIKVIEASNDGDLWLIADAAKAIEEAARKAAFVYVRVEIFEP
jgi:hypothetical protein